MFYRILISTVLVLTCVSTGFADQAAYISEAQAKKAASFLEKKGAVMHFCAPCGDSEATFEKIETIESVHTGYENYWEVKINGKGVDLAYLYYRKRGKRWKNTAMRMDIKVEDVPRFLSRPLVNSALQAMKETARSHVWTSNGLFASNLRASSDRPRRVFLTSSGSSRST